MRSKSWETRVAAGNAIEAIARNLSYKGIDNFDSRTDGGMRSLILARFYYNKIMAYYK